MVKFDKDTSDYALNNPDYKWQVIFKTEAGLDYCRETKNGNMTKAQIYRWATHITKTHEHAKHAEIQRW